MTDWATTAITAWEQGEYGTLEESRAAHRAMLRKVKANGLREAISYLETRFHNIAPDDPYRDKDFMHCLELDGQDAITKSYIGYLRREANIIDKEGEA